MRHTIATGTAVMTLACLLLAPAHTLAAPTTIHIPVIVNIYPNSGVTTAEAKEIVEKSNEMLAQAGFKMHVVKTNGGDSGNPLPDPSGDDGDGDFTTAEGDAVQEAGGKELENTPNQKGIKISFGRTPWVGHATPGWSVHRNPTIVMRERDTVQESAETLAHELGHVMTLNAGHKIDDDTNANGGGHAPDQDGDDGNGNLMAPSNRRTGTHLTQDQIDEMRSRRYVHGKCSTQWEEAYPAERDHQQYGTSADDLNDHTGFFPHHDLNQIFLTGLHESDMTGGDTINIDTQITVVGPLPIYDFIDVTYTLAFNTDNDPYTGVVYLEQYWGIDRIVQLDAFGVIEDGTFGVWAYVYDPVTGYSWDLPEPPIWTTEGKFVDLDYPAEPWATSFLLQIPKDTLNLHPDMPEIPVVATSGSYTGGVFDTAEFYFDQYRWLDDPGLYTFGDGVPVPGQPYDFAVEALDPESPFELYLDDTVVCTGMTDDFGNAFGSFEFPIDLPTDVPHFLTAQDQTGEFAYSMTCPEQQIPGDLDHDGDVDLNDLATQLSHYGEVGNYLTYEDGDIDGDFDVDLTDLSILLANYGTGG